MNRYEEYNRHFSLEHHIGVAISEEQFQSLMAEGRLFVSSAYFTRSDAVKAMGGDPKIYPHDVQEYLGLIVADSMQEAKQTARERGWNETVDFVLTGIFDEDAVADISLIHAVQSN